MTAISHKNPGLLILALGLVLLVACAPRQNLLNSDRIEQRFGSYGINVLSQDRAVRRASLYSLEDGRQVCRTYAITLYADSIGNEITELHETIADGASIGATFRGHGWAVKKRTLHIESIQLRDSGHPLASLMALDAPAELATHVYDLHVEKGPVQYRYARIVETHHPEYLGVDQLREIYGSSMPDFRVDMPAIDTLVLIDHWN